MAAPAELSGISEQNASFSAPKKKPLISPEVYRGLAEGDENAWTDFVPNAMPHLIGIAQRIFPKREDAEEIVNDALVKFADKLPINPQIEDNPSGYLRRTIVNTALSRIRTRQYKTTSMITTMDMLGDELNAGYYNVYTPRQPSIEDQYLAAEELAEERARIGQLPGHQQTIILMAGMGYPYKEIAEVLDIPIGSVASGISRAREALAQSTNLDTNQENKIKRGKKPHPTNNEALKNVEALIKEVVVFSAA